MWSNYLLHIYYVSGSVLGPEVDTTVKIDRAPAITELIV